MACLGETTYAQSLWNFLRTLLLCSSSTNNFPCWIQYAEVCSSLVQPILTQKYPLPISIIQKVFFRQPGRYSCLFYGRNCHFNISYCFGCLPFCSTDHFHRIFHHWYALLWCYFVSHWSGKFCIIVRISLTWSNFLFVLVHCPFNLQCKCCHFKYF